MNNAFFIQNLCTNLARLRRRADLSVEEMACRLGINAAQLGLLENGVLPETLTVEALVRLEKEFGISLKEMFLPG